MKRKDALEREIQMADAELDAIVLAAQARRQERVEGASRELEKLASLPDLDVMVNGTVAALGVSYGRSRPYIVIGYKVANRWYCTGDSSPNKVSSEDLAEWLTTRGRRLVMCEVIAEIESISVDVVDLGAMLAGMRG